MNQFRHSGGASHRKVSTDRGQHEARTTSLSYVYVIIKGEGEESCSERVPTTLTFG